MTRVVRPSILSFIKNKLSLAAINSKRNYIGIEMEDK